MDAARTLLDNLFRISIINLNWDPSGEGCEIIWYPEGLSGARELHTKGAHFSVPLAMMIAALRMWTYAETVERFGRSDER